MVCTGVGLAGSLWAGTHAQVPPYTFVVVVCNRQGVAMTDPGRTRLPSNSPGAVYTVGPEKILAAAAARDTRCTAANAGRLSLCST
jgi:hypothetical protein